MTWIIVLLGAGYTIALTLVIVGCTEENVFWLLFLLAPYVFTPTMTVFIPNDPEDNNFWVQLALFIMAVSLVSAFAMPLVFWSNGGIGNPGLGYGLGASFTLYAFMGGAGFIAFKEDY